MDRIPLNHTLAQPIANIVDDSQTDSRAPSHSQIEFIVTRLSLEQGDPKTKGAPVGKAKRVRAIISWGIDNNQDAAEKFAYELIVLVVNSGGFQTGSDYIGEKAILNLITALKTVNVDLTKDGILSFRILTNLSKEEYTEALMLNVKRAKNGVEDAAFLVGIGKDLLEAVSLHVLEKKWGSIPDYKNFPLLLGQAFAALGIKTPQDKLQPGEHPRCKVERCMYEQGCSLNTLRNKHGVGHGRNFVPDLEEFEGKFAIETMGTICDYMLNKLKF